jgi:hypothetical protein
MSSQQESFYYYSVRLWHGVVFRIPNPKSTAFNNKLVGRTVNFCKTRFRICMQSMLIRWEMREITVFGRILAAAAQQDL